MNVTEAIEARHATRAYDDRVVDEWVVESLLHAACQAPTAMDEHPLIFSVVQDRERLRRWSDRAKSILLARVGAEAKAGPYAVRLADPKFNVFYDAGTLVVIGARSPGPYAEADCWLAAENLMLAACEHGLGTCVVGSATAALSAPDIKQELAFPPLAVVIAPIILGYPRKAPAAEASAPPRADPRVLSWY